MKSILVFKRGERYEAQIAQDPHKTAIGDTIYEAVGRLVSCYREEFLLNISIMS